MNAEQLLIQIRANRDLLTRYNEHAFEDFQMLKNNYQHLANEEVILNLELNESYIAFHINSDYRKAIDISLVVLDKYKHTVYKSLLSRHMRIIGESYAHIGEYDLAERFLIEAMDNLDSTEAGYATFKAQMLYNLAMTYEFKATGREKAIDYLNQALGLLGEPADAIRRGNCYMGLGNVYNSLNNMPEALNMYLQAATIFEKEYFLANMASVYCNIGNCYLKFTNFELALEYHEKALQLRIKIGSPYALALSYFNYGVVYKAMGDLLRAEDLLTKALNIVEELGDKLFAAQVNKELDDLEIRKRNQKTA